MPRGACLLPGRDDFQFPDGDGFVELVSSLVVYLARLPLPNFTRIPAQRKDTLSTIVSQDFPVIFAEIGRCSRLAEARNNPERIVHDNREITI